MSNLVMWGLVIAFFMPLVQSAIVQFNWSHGAAAVASFLACAVAGAGNAYFNADLNGKTFVQSALIVLVGTIAIYQGLWKPTGVAGRIETLTSPGGAPSGPRPLG